MGRILELLTTLRIPLSSQVDETTFLRRITLDLTVDCRQSREFVSLKPIPSAGQVG